MSGDIGFDDGTDGIIPTGNASVEMFQVVRRCKGGIFILGVAPFFTETLRLWSLRTFRAFLTA
jgi:hypothetical protein